MFKSAKQIVVMVKVQKFITIKVTNSKSIIMQKIAFTVGNSPLLKTAVAGEDPNWGRIIMGIGKSGEIVDSEKIIIKFGDFVVAENGKISDLGMKKISKNMKWDSIRIEINLNQGGETFECYTCHHDYIDINADYRN